MHSQPTAAESVAIVLCFLFALGAGLFAGGVAFRLGGNTGEVFGVLLLVGCAVFSLALGIAAAARRRLEVPRG